MEKALNGQTGAKLCHLIVSSNCESIGAVFAAIGSAVKSLNSSKPMKGSAIRVWDSLSLIIGPCGFEPCFGSIKDVRMSYFKNGFSRAQRNFFFATANTLIFMFQPSADAQMRQKAEISDAGWCAIQAQMTIKSVYKSIDKSRGDGFGRIVCKYIDGTEEILPVRLKTKGIGIGGGSGSKAQQFLNRSGSGDLQTSDDASGISTVINSPGFRISIGDARLLLGTYTVASTGIHNRVSALGGKAMVRERAIASRRGLALPMTFESSGARASGFGVFWGYMQITYDSQNTAGQYLENLPIQTPAMRSSPFDMAMSQSLPQLRNDGPRKVGTPEDVKGSSDGRL